MDMFNGLKAENENSVSNRIAKRNEEKEINGLADRIVDDVIRQISYRFEKFERNDFSVCDGYNSLGRLSEQDRIDLKKSLEEQIKQIPGKLSSELSKIFGTSEEKKEEKNVNSSAETEDEGGEESTTASIATVDTANVNSSVSSAFGY